MSKYQINDIIKDAVQSFELKAFNLEGLFEHGTKLEILSNAGNNQVKNSIITTLTEAVNEAKAKSRRQLVEKNIISSLERHGDFDDETRQTLSNRVNSLQIDYENSYKEVLRLEKLLSNFEN